MGKVAALFDLDGVLVDTESVYTIFWENIDRMYPTGVNDFAHAIKGNTLDHILGTYFPVSEERNKILELLKEQEREMRYGLFPGVAEFLSELRERWIDSAIVTSSNDLKMGNLFAQLPDFKENFGTVVTDGMVSRSKPDPQGYILAACNLGCDPADCYVFEDSFAGIEAGHRAGCKVIALATTNVRGSLEDKADKVIDSFIGFGVDDMLSI